MIEIVASMKRFIGGDLVTRFSGQSYWSCLSQKSISLLKVVNEI